MKTNILALLFIVSTSLNASAEILNPQTEGVIQDNDTVSPYVVEDERPVVKAYQTQSSTDAAGNTTTNTVITESPAPIADTPITTTVTVGEYQRLIDAGGNYNNSEDVYHPKIEPKQ